MSSLKAVVVLLALSLASCYVRISDLSKLHAYYNDNFHYPIIQIFHNDYFLRSAPFEDIESVFQEAEYKFKDFSRYVMFNCEKVRQGDSNVCDELREKKLNRKVVAYYPADTFMNYGGKRLQDSPLSQQYNHESDVFQVAEFEKLLDGIMPNFYEEMTSLEEYQEWLKVRHSPKLVFLTRQEEIPLVLRQLAVHFFSRFDFAFVSDLTESITQQMNITSFPKLLVVKYNYEEFVYDIFHYKANDFLAKDFHAIKTFLDQHALNEPRNDYLFHNIKMPKQRGIVLANNKTELLRELDRAQGWVIISEGKGDAKLRAVQEKYGRYFQYVHLEIDNETELLGLYDHEKQKSYEMPNDQVAFKPLSTAEFAKATTLWMAKDFVVISVRESYSHICAIQRYPLFKGLTHCLIIKDQDYEQTSKAIKIKFQYGFVSYQTSANITEKIKGKTFKNATFEEVYSAIETLTRMKSTEIVEDFKKQPVRQVEKSDQLESICSLPSKKCALLFTHGPKKDRTAYEYLQEVAINFINQYEFYEVDLTCNAHFLAEIASLKSNYGGLVVYHPSKKSFVSLKAKLSKSTFEKFLKANLRDNKKLPFHPFSNSSIEISSCSSSQPQVAPQESQSESL